MLARLKIGHQFPFTQSCFAIPDRKLSLALYVQTQWTGLNPTRKVRCIMGCEEEVTNAAQFSTQNLKCIAVVFFEGWLIGRWTHILPLCFSTHPGVEYLTKPCEPATDELVMLPVLCSTTKPHCFVKRLSTHNNPRCLNFNQSFQKWCGGIQAQAGYFLQKQKKRGSTKRALWVFKKWESKIVYEPGKHNLD